ncbi:hypothetical protein [Comamonas sp.]|uniref:hypothetical protein n=1 Tax=Comamonas sp. TaxID=34028 RepID=UPI00289E4757|nr:hypothetical protein [Comamonas sp.]
MELDNRAPRTVQELEQMGHALAQEIFHKVLKGRTLCASVVMHAALTMHRGTSKTLPPEAQRDIGYALATYAGTLIATPHAQAQTEHEPHQFPTDLPTAIQ